jgi:hypothetical protein
VDLDPSWLSRDTKAERLERSRTESLQHPLEGAGQTATCSRSTAPSHARSGADRGCTRRRNARAPVAELEDDGKVYKSIDSEYHFAYQPALFTEKRSSAKEKPQTGASESSSTCNHTVATRTPALPRKALRQSWV